MTLRRYVSAFCIIFAAAFLVLVTGCDQYDAPDQEATSIRSITLYADGVPAQANTDSCSSTSFWFPKGTSFAIYGSLKRMKGKNMFRVDGPFQPHLPNGFSIVSRSSDGEVTQSNRDEEEDPEISCNCSSGGNNGCYTEMNPNDPADAECKSNGECTPLDDCYFKITTSSMEEGSVAGGVIRGDLQVEFASRATYEDAAAAFPMLFDLPEVQNRITRFADQYIDGATPPVQQSADRVTAPSGHTFAVLSVAGRTAFMALSSDHVPNRALQTNTLACNGGHCTYDQDSSAVNGPLVLATSE